MRTDPNPVPEGQGLYALVHSASKSLYIGSSINLRGRAYEWRWALATRSEKLRNGAFPEYPIDEWEFRVLVRTEGMTYNELRTMEQGLIKRAVERGMSLLNRNRPAVRYQFTLDGHTGSALFHATRLGKSPTKVNAKLRRGWTIEQALGRAPPPTDLAPSTRDMALSFMPVRLLDDEGEPMTYAEAKETYPGVNFQNRVKQLRKVKPDTKEVLASLLAAKMGYEELLL